VHRQSLFPIKSTERNRFDSAPNPKPVIDRLQECPGESTSQTRDDQVADLWGQLSAAIDRQATTADVQPIIAGLQALHEPCHPLEPASDYRLESQEATGVTISRAEAEVLFCHYHREYHSTREWCEIEQSSGSTERRTLGWSAHRMEVHKPHVANAFLVAARYDSLVREEKLTEDLARIHRDQEIQGMRNRPWSDQDRKRFDELHGQQFEDDLARAWKQRVKAAVHLLDAIRQEWSAINVNDPQTCIGSAEIRILRQDQFNSLHHIFPDHSDEELDAFVQGRGIQSHAGPKNSPSATDRNEESSC
jgi:hypothetical protein